MEVKEAPARGLRAVFAGFGRALGGRRKDAAAPAAPAKAPAGDSGHVKVVDTEETVAPETTAAPETSAAPESVAGPETVAPEAVAPEAEPQAAAEVPAAEAPAAEAAPPAEASGDLPLANYDTLTVASLRARLRTLSVPQLRILVDYENAHQGREEVTGMFERRIAKIVAGETSSFPAAN
jgi:cytoskeletal protein RodZ